MSKDSFTIFLLAVIFTSICFLAFLEYINIRINIEALAKPNEVCINNYTVKEADISEKKVRGK